MLFTSGAAGEAAVEGLALVAGLRNGAEAEGEAEEATEPRDPGPSGVTHLVFGEREEARVVDVSGEVEAEGRGKGAGVDAGANEGEDSLILEDSFIPLSAARAFIGLMALVPPPALAPNMLGPPSEAGQVNRFEGIACLGSDTLGGLASGRGSTDLPDVESSDRDRDGEAGLGEVEGGEVIKGGEEGQAVVVRGGGEMGGGLKLDLGSCCV